jgi:hypothetical protein
MVTAAGNCGYGTVTDDGRLDLFAALSGLYMDGFRVNSN